MNSVARPKVGVIELTPRWRIDRRLKVLTCILSFLVVVHGLIVPETHWGIRLIIIFVPLIVIATWWQGLGAAVYITYVAAAVFAVYAFVPQYDDYPAQVIAGLLFPALLITAARTAAARNSDTSDVGVALRQWDQFRLTAPEAPARIRTQDPERRRTAIGAQGLSAVAAVAGIALLPVGGSVVVRVLAANRWERSRRASMPTLEELRQHDPRRPAFLLRSFTLEQLPGYSTFEEELVKEFEHVAPVVALGRPGDELPPVGAAREYVTDDSETRPASEMKAWQSRVQTLVESSAIVVVMIGPTAGLQWELRELERLDCWNRTLVIVSPAFSDNERLWEGIIAAADGTSLAPALRECPATARILLGSRPREWEAISSSSSALGAYKLALRVALGKLLNRGSFVQAG